MSELTQSLTQANTYVSAAEQTLKIRFDGARSDKRRQETAALAEIISDAGIQITRAMEAAQSAHIDHLNFMSDVEACANALALCRFLFEQMHEITPQDTKSDVALHSFTDIGRQLAEAAEEAALDVVDALRKEVDHD